MESIRVKTREELEECFSIRTRVFVEEQQVPMELEMDEYDVSPEACRHFLIRDGKTYAAAARWKVLEEGTAKLQRIAVLPEYRSHGVGRLVVSAMEQDARQAGMKACVLDAQCRAEGFYAKLGYRTVSPETFLDAGILHVRMKKEL